MLVLVDRGISHFFLQKGLDKQLFLWYTDTQETTVHSVCGTSDQKKGGKGRNWVFAQNVEKRSKKVNFVII